MVFVTDFFALAVAGMLGALALCSFMPKRLRALWAQLGPGAGEEAETPRLFLFWCRTCGRSTLAQHASSLGAHATCVYCGEHVLTETPADRAAARRQRREAEVSQQQRRVRRRRAQEAYRRMQQNALWGAYLSRLKAEAAEPSSPDPEEERCRRVLGVAHAASFEEIKARYRKLALRYHPDRTGRLADAKRTHAQAQTRRINAAYAYLRKKRDQKKAMA